MTWPHSAENIILFFNYMNNTDRTKKIQFTMQIEEDVLEFLYFKLTFDKRYKRISVQNFAKAANNFKYVLPSTCFHKNSIEDVPKGVELGLKKICDSHDKFEEHEFCIRNNYLPEIVSLVNL